MIYRHTYRSAVLVAFSYLSYVGFFIFTFRWFNDAAFLFCILPPLAAGIAFGSRWGLAGGFAVLFFNAGLAHWAHGTAVDPKALPAVVLLPFMGFAIGKVRDMNQALRKHLEESSRLRANLRKRDAELASSGHLAALGQMASGIAHEINNPLAIIRGWAESAVMQAKSTHYGNDVFNPAEALNEIMSATDRINVIVQGMRRLARDSADEPVTKESIQAIISQTLGICAERLKVHGIDLKVDMPNPALTVLCRPVQISQVLLNLLNNACDAIEHHAVEEPRIRIMARENGSWGEILVSNNGPPIPKVFRDRIFTPFFTTKEAGKGTGLGLSISRTILQRNLGELFLSEENNDTTFVVRLPSNVANIGFDSDRLTA